MQRTKKGLVTSSRSTNDRREAWNCALTVFGGPCLVEDERAKGQRRVSTIPTPFRALSCMEGLQYLAEGLSLMTGTSLLLMLRVKRLRSLSCIFAIEETRGLPLSSFLELFPSDGLVSSVFLGKEGWRRFNGVVSFVFLEDLEDFGVDGKVEDLVGTEGCVAEGGVAFWLLFLLCDVLWG